MGIAVALSGGVDSSVCAYLLKKRGEDVFGITLRLTDDYSEEVGSAIYNARKLCNKLDIKHIVIDVRKDFQEIVIDSYKKGLLAGKTMVPCAICNQFIKLGKLVDFCRSNGAKLATGHYAKIVKTVDGAKIYRAKDALKDQTHFLAYLNKNNLNDIEFPLGDKYKSEVFKIAEENKLVDIIGYTESQDVCFFNGDTYKNYLKSLNINDVSGDIVHCITMKKLGTHKGLLKFTVGQRKGIDLPWSEPLYVVSRDFQNNILYVGEEMCLYFDKLTIKDVNIIDNHTEEDIKNNKKINCQVCLRDKTPIIDATVDFSENSQAPTVYLKQRARAITSGQVCVFYNNGQLLGGGEIV